MASVADLKTVLTDTLDKRGVIGQLKAQIRAEVFAALDDQSEPRPVLSHENLLINEMIREYLDFNKYKYSSSVLTAETGLSDIPLDRSFLARELKFVEDANAQSVPILYGILSHFLYGHRVAPCHSVLEWSSENPTQRHFEGTANRIMKVDADSCTYYKRSRDSIPHRDVKSQNSQLQCGSRSSEVT
ncbi:PREDICTED: lisH domain-containing protein FOPNL [Nanorana parkeri]|uniref:lisH domain-containing protein FOPNL n=1 Tax=Nanorana parkeri TaxID=125878 RepID=UPI000854C550|nr:PREDICTED: lisH domain-containing protein FOPNL [Nanorana parkeri]